ncbi:hypothetical protein [Vitreimonas flagellata]|uniref:hypothetical protein n=1 Tax=Vitreimonas flagellata TaxID=2560861 RepID=UPI0010757722|nr:hypothetical protein [Vitreimonas flagellata]
MHLWFEAFASYWRDPRNVIGPPGALVRRLFKFAWLVLSIYVLCWIAGPSQVASWRLWMADDRLATDIAWGFTFAGALGFAIVRYAAEGTSPVRVPLIVPILEFDEQRFKGLKIRSAHLHLPNVTVGAGALLVAALFAISLLGMWNYYLHEQRMSGGASVVAIDGATSSVSEATSALQRHNLEAAQRAEQGRAELARTPENFATARSRIITANTEQTRLDNAERARLEAALQAARSANVTTHQEFTDPRPVDGEVASATGLARELVASLLDLLRSGVVEMLLVLGAGLGLVGATSKLGVLEGEPVSQNPPTNEDEEIIAPATPADDLDLPILADWRLVEDPEFTQRHMMVDEHGRRQKRVAGHWRVDDDRAPRGSSRDRRRSDSEPTADNPEEPGPQSPPEGDDIDDLMSKLTGARVPEEQTQ